ncbi:MAG TPA: hypothetical protein VMH49_03085 [Thermoplasmata archaeon]|nr:hypothetical protein [Thermoplasmata archaeon]
MAADLPPGEERDEPTTVHALPLHRRVAFWGFATLVVLAVVFYLWWGLSFGVWIDNGVYAVTITLLLFGLAGMWLVLPNRPAPATPP